MEKEIQRAPLDKIVNAFELALARTEDPNIDEFRKAFAQVRIGKKDFTLLNAAEEALGLTPSTNVGAALDKQCTCMSEYFAPDLVDIAYHDVPYVRQKIAQTSQLLANLPDSFRPLTELLLRKDIFVNTLLATYRYDVMYPQYQVARQGIIGYLLFLSEELNNQGEGHLTEETYILNAIQQRHEALREELSNWTDYQVTQSVIKELPEPNTELKYVFNIPVYKEMDPNAPPGLIATLHSIAAAVKKLAEYNPNAYKMAEVISNFNNPKFPSDENESFGSLKQNRLSLEVIKALQDPNMSAKAIVDHICNVYGQNGVWNYYVEEYLRKVLPQIKSACDMGLRIMSLDCTDGKYIAREHDADSIILYRPNQGTRCRLLSIIASQRLAEANQEQGYQIRLDADVRIPEYYLVECEEHTRIASNDVLSFPRVFVPHEQFPGNEEQLNREKLALAANLKFYYSDLRGIASQIADPRTSVFVTQLKAHIRIGRAGVDIGSHTIGNSLVATNFNLLIPDKVMRDVNWYTIHYMVPFRGGGEDSNLLRKIASAHKITALTDSSAIEISHRIRPESYHGNSDHWYHVNEHPVEFYMPVAIKLQKVLVDFGYKTNSEVLDVTPYNFPRRIFSTIAKISLTEQELRLLELEQCETMSQIQLLQHLVSIGCKIAMSSSTERVNYPNLIKVFVNLSKRLQEAGESLKKFGIKHELVSFESP